MSDRVEENQRITIAIAAMGGQGGGVLADWLIALAEANDYYAQSTSVPGVAQRTGATIYYLEFIPDIPGAEPVLALMPVPGDVHVVIAAELVEAGRAVQRGIITSDITTLIASNHRAYSYLEKSALGDGRIDAKALEAQLVKTAKKFVCFDMQTMAEQHGTVISATLFGALAGAKALPFTREEFENAIKGTGKSVESNLAAFDAAFRQAEDGNPSARRDQQDNDLDTIGADKAESNTLGVQHYPLPTREVINTVIKRLIDYQDSGYVKTYLERLNRIHLIDSRHGGDAKNWTLTSATAKHLGLWMTYEDTIRVADLKIRRERFERSRVEVNASDLELVYLTEFMHPRVEEVADTLPSLLGGVLLKSATLKSWLSRYVLTERKIQTAKLSGFMLLYALAGMRRFRRGTLRYKNEQRRINDWLNRIEATAIEHYELAVEVAKCQNLVKGYGDTHERGLKNFNRIMAHLDSHPNESADKVKEMREAALADEFGTQLTQMLSEAA